MPWAQEKQTLQDAGFNEQEVQAHRMKVQTDLVNAGFTAPELSKYFGDTSIDPTEPIPTSNDRIKGLVSGNLKDYNPEIADNPLDAFNAGLQASSGGLAVRGKLPDTVPDEDAGTLSKLLYEGGMLIGDIPAAVTGFVAGASAGGTAGSAVPVVGTAIGALAGGGAGSAMLPTATREVLMDMYEKGEITSSREFFERAIPIIKDTLEQGAAGLVGGAAGGKVLQTAGKMGVGAFKSSLLAGASELVGYTGAMSAINRQIPDMQDFTDGAVFMLLFGGAAASVKGAKTVTTRLRNVYKDTGLPPSQVASAAQHDPVIFDEIVSRDAMGNQVLTKLKENALPDPQVPVKKPSTEGVTVQEPIPDKTLTVPGEEPVTPSYREAEAAILSRVEERPTQKTRDLLKPDILYKQFVDQNSPINQMEKLFAPEGLSADKSPSVLVRNTAASGHRASYMLREGIIDGHTGLEVSQTSYLGGIRKAIEAGGDEPGVRAYMISKRVLELEGKEIKHGFDVEAAKKVVDEGRSKYEAANQEIQASRNGKLDYAAAKGLYSAESLKAMKANESYAPMMRVIGEEGTAVVAGKSLKVRNPLKRITGSDAPIIDPIAADFENFHLVTAMADRNEALGAIVKLAEGSPELSKDIIVKTKTKVAPVEIKEKEIKQLLSEHGITPEELEPFLIFRASRKSLGPDEVVFFRDGKPEVWEFQDKEIARLYKSQTAEQTNILTKIIYGAAKWKRSGITAMPDFPVRTTLRDQLTSAILTDHGYVPFVDLVHGAIQIFSKEPGRANRGSEIYRAWWRDGGAGAALTSMDANYFQRDINRLFKETGTLDALWNTVKSPIEAGQLMQEIFDAAQRVGLEKRLAQGQDITKVSRADRLSFATKSRKAFLDFAQKGSSQIVNMLSQSAPFTRPTILGLEQFVDAIKKNPKSTAAKTIAGVTLPTMALYALNYYSDQHLPPGERYSDLPRWQRDNFWVFPPLEMADGQLVRIRLPKPPVLGVLAGAMPERFMDYFLKQDTEAFHDWSGSMLAQLIPPVIPAVVLPVVEAWGNRSTFTGRPLVPTSMEQASGYMQYTENTTEIAKALSRFLSPKKGVGIADISPIIIENYVRQYTGPLGISALKLLNAPLKEEGLPWQVKDIPIVQAFVAMNPGAGAQPIQDYYTKLDEFRTAKRDLSLAMDRMDVQEIQENAEDFRAFVQLNGISKALSTTYSIIKNIDKVKGKDGKEMTTAEKRQFIQKVYSDMIVIAQGGLKLMESVEEQKK